MLTKRLSQKKKRKKSLYESIMNDVSKVVKKHLNEFNNSNQFKVVYVQDAEDGMAIIQDDDWIYYDTYKEAFDEAVDWADEGDIWDMVKNTIWEYDYNLNDYVDSKQTPPDIYNEFGYNDIGTIILAPANY